MTQKNENSNYEEFKARRELWSYCLKGEERNSLMQQIYQMIWNTAVFRLINEARRLAPPAGDGGVQLNGMIHRFINDTYFENQLLAIRRLTDPSKLKKQKIDGKDKSVYSLISLIRDMKAFTSFMTRENLFKVESIPYDYELVRKNEYDYLFGRIREKSEAFWVPGDVDWEASKERHVQIDKLTGVSDLHRSPDDKVLPELFDCLEKYVSENCMKIRNYVDKFVAHAATKESREAVNWKIESVSFGEIWEAQSVIGKIANFISDDILHDGGNSFLATPQYNHLAYIDRPLINKEDIPKLEQLWESFGEETSGWINLTVDEILMKK